MSEETPVSKAPADKAAPEHAGGVPVEDSTAPKDPKGSKETGETPVEQRPAGEEHDGPVSESDALRSLAQGAGRDEDERSESLRAGAIADLIAQRLNADASGTRIGTLALFNDSVSFGGGFHTDGRRTTGTRARGGTSVLAVDANELTEHTDLFVQPEGYDDALDALREHRILVLTGAPGSGREATGVNLLAEAMALGGTGDGGCHRLLAPAVILESGWTPPVKNGGYLAVLEDGPAGVREFTAAFGVRSAAGTRLRSTAAADGGVGQLAAVAAALRASDSHLVLVGGRDLARAAAGPGGDTVGRHELAPVDPRTIVERRVLGLGGDPGARAELSALLESTGAVGALCEQPAARHAADLAKVIRAGGDVAAAVAALRDPSEQVRGWFDRFREPEALAFALASAVLEECSYLTVADAAVDLWPALTPPDEPLYDLRFRDRLGHEQQWIRLDFGDGPAATGPPRVRFRSPLLGQVILAYAWGTLDSHRRSVLAWLRRLLTHADVEVRARAAVSAGVIAWADHHYAVHRFLTSWASSTSWPLRQSAATALGVAGSRPESSEAVWQLLHEWARGGTSAGQRRLAGTAANAVGGLLGRDAPERAVAVLRDALDREDDWGTLPSVAWGGVHLVHQGQAGVLLNAYLDWSEPQDLSPMVVKSLSAFVFAVSQPYEERAGGPDGDGPAGVPGAPVLLSGLPRHAEPLAELWARALARRPVQDTALEALRAWIDDYADKCPGALDSIGALLVGIARRPGRHRERLLWWLAKWAGDRENPSARAQELLRLLERRT
ncbi:hypothetical protein HRW14_00190 [Streptomyces lunaelactis]|uniref:hypothetical protein n=1 Tax=Streptomyces lunaelactis TaxID=1535768 RepID=UPI00158475F8|nr:hypothetical protein [Streptomyces lunaelactis]NUK48750.1 hypothetical protein [Streptomyces lunaelactis]NUK62603.1 hypothetical protein [Streptomyces lunaelactis]